MAATGLQSQKAPSDEQWQALPNETRMYAHDQVNRLSSNGQVVATYTE